MDYRIISIGALAQHPLWDNDPGQRTAHATTSLIRTDDAQTILVDPALPAQALHARLAERAGLRPTDITHVFLTTFRPEHRRALLSFEKATWYISENERETIGVNLIAQLEKAGDEETQNLLKQDIAILQRCKAAPKQLAQQVDLFPLPGYTPGSAGLILAPATHTVVVAGPAVPTVEHLQRGQVLSGCHDLEQARQSFKDVLEIADLIVPGYDNIQPNLMSGPF